MAMQTVYYTISGVKGAIYTDYHMSLGVVQHTYLVRRQNTSKIKLTKSFHQNDLILLSSISIELIALPFLCHLALKFGSLFDNSSCALHSISGWAKLIFTFKTPIISIFCLSFTLKNLTILSLFRIIELHAWKQ